MSFLSRVASHSDANRMTATNLGVVFGPNIIWDDNDNDIQSSLKANATLEHMISFYSEIFKTPTKDVSNITPEDEEQESDDPTYVTPRKRSGLTPLNIAKKIGVGSLLEKEKGDFAKSGGTLISRLLPQRAPSIRPDMKTTSEASLRKFLLLPVPHTPLLW
jgi:hypothetical protein